MQEAYEVLSNLQERAYYDDNREQVLMSDDEDEDEKQTAEVEAELDFYKWASREAFVDFTHGATHATAPTAPTPTPKDIPADTQRHRLDVKQRRTASSLFTATSSASCMSRRRPRSMATSPVPTLGAQAPR